MKGIKSVLLIIILVIGFHLGSFAQASKASLQPNIGIATPILDGGIGISLSLNGHQPLNSYFGLEGQIAYIYSRIKGSFISGRQGSINSISALAGLRLYFNPKDDIRFYINGLVGYTAYNETLDGTEFKERDPGMSLGAFLDFNRKYVVGLSLEAPKFVVLRFGYVL
jgi:hypothetical protein